MGARRESRRLHWPLVVCVAMAASCRCERKDPKDASTQTVGSSGGSGSGYTAQCSGWFPDWISRQPVPAGKRSFQLSQGYPRGVPKIEEVNGELKITGWDPYPPADTVAEAPWLAHDFTTAAGAPLYLEALKTYLLEGNTGNADVEDDFNVQNNKIRSWYHVPMMTSGPARRDPRHGLTRERPLDDEDHPWIVNGFNPRPECNDEPCLRSYAIGAYNWLGGYTIGQVFDDPIAQNAKPQNGKFIPGAFVFKLLFAEYPATAGHVDPARDPLIGSPQWIIQDPLSTSGAEIPVRLLQVDVAVRDARATKTGWVFATFVYDKTMTAPTPWAKLRPVGLMWGDDAGDTTAAAIDETWPKWPPPGFPADLFHEDPASPTGAGTSTIPYGKLGRLNGPVDNPISSCISCHGTAQIVTGATSAAAMRGAPLVPPTSCSDAQDLFWFHDVAAGVPFGVMSSGGTGCTPASPVVGTPPLHSQDYSLQLAVALTSSLFYGDVNPCKAMADGLQDIAVVETPRGDLGAIEAKKMQLKAENLKDLRMQKGFGLPAEVLRKRAVAPARVENVQEKANKEREEHPSLVR